PGGFRCRPRSGRTARREALMARWLGGIAMVLVLVTALVYAAGLGVFGREMHAGKPAARAIAKEIVGARADAVSRAAHGIGGGAEADPVRRPARAHTALVRRLHGEPADGGRRRRTPGRRCLRLRAPLLGARLLVDHRPRPNAHAAHLERDDRDDPAVQRGRGGPGAPRHRRISRLGADAGGLDAREPL